MIVHIPSHLELIPVVNQFSQMIQSYSELYPESTELGSFDYYYSHYSNDFVKQFIKLSLESQGIDPDDENTVNYLTKLFYSVKGTQKIFEYMHKYLGINFIGDVSYSINEVVFEIEEVTVTDISVYIKTLKEFLSALLYYYDLNIIIDLMNLKVSEVLSVYYSASAQKYKEFSVSAMGEY